MSERVVRSSAVRKILAAIQILSRDGPSALKRSVGAYLVYHFELKWDFVYLSFDLDQEFTRVPLATALTVRVATRADLDRIRAELFPEMTGEQAYEKRYFDLLGRDGVRCFVGESEGAFVHYSWVFLDARTSPLLDTPFDRARLRDGDVYVGPVFTSPRARGFVYPQVLSTMVRHLKEVPGATRIVLFVQGRNPAAVSYYMRFRFTRIEDAVARPVWVRLWKKLTSRRS